MTVGALIKNLSQYPYDLEVCDNDGNYVVGSHKVKNIIEDDGNDNVEVQLMVFREEDTW